jgi:hypothetical protein
LPSSASNEACGPEQLQIVPTTIGLPLGAAAEPVVAVVLATVEFVLAALVGVLAALVVALDATAGAELLLPLDPHADTTTAVITTPTVASARCLRARLGDFTSLSFSRAALPDRLSRTVPYGVPCTVRVAYSGPRLFGDE